MRTTARHRGKNCRAGRQVNYGKVSIEEFERRVRDDFARVRKSVQEAGIPPQE